MGTPTGADPRRPGVMQGRAPQPATGGMHQGQAPMPTGGVMQGQAPMPTGGMHQGPAPMPTGGVQQIDPRAMMMAQRQRQLPQQAAPQAMDGRQAAYARFMERFGGVPDQTRQAIMQALQGRR